MYRLFCFPKNMLLMIYWTFILICSHRQNTICEYVIVVGFLTSCHYAAIGQGEGDADVIREGVRGTGRQKINSQML